MRKPIIAGNWKMNKTVKKSASFVTDLKKHFTGYSSVEIVICPPYTALWEVAKTIEGTNISLGAQDMYWEAAGAFTGEISPLMLVEVGCEYVIIGHSERRQFFHETDEIINTKIKAAFAYRLKPIFCLGENIQEREAGKAEEVVYNQLTKGLADLARDDVERIVIAYEPIWAIGTGKTATPEDANAIHFFIRRSLSNLYDKQVASEVRIQYGGSVRPDNIDSLMAQSQIDGALVGGASLDVSSFVRIVKFKREI